MFVPSSLPGKPTALFLSCALVFLANNTVAAAKDPVQLTTGNATLTQNINLINPTQTSKWTSVAVQVKGENQTFVVDDRHISLTVDAEQKNATAVELSGADTPVSFSAKNAQVAAKAENGDAKALLIKGTTNASIVGEGSRFEAVSTNGVATALDISSVRNENTSVSLEGVTLAATSVAHPEKAIAIYAGHSKTDKKYQSTVTLKNSTIESGNVLFQSSAEANTQANHAYTLNVENSTLGSASQQIRIESSVDQDAQYNIVGSASNSLTVNASGTSSIYADVVGTTKPAEGNTNVLTSQIQMNLTGKDVQWTGTANKAQTSSSSASVKLSDGSAWTNTGSSSISSLTLDKGTVDISKGSIQTQKLDADNGGTVKFDAASSHTLTADQSSGTVVLENTGDWSQGVNSNTHVIQTGDQKLTATLQGGTTDAGLGQFELVKTEEGYKLVQVGASNASSVIQALAASPVDVANLQLRTLTEHQTALRMSDNVGNGVWAQYMGSKQSRTTASDAHYRLHVNGVMVGADSRQVLDDGHWAVGAAFSYARGDVSALDSSADIDGYSLHLYGVREFDNGFFVHGSAMLGRLTNDAEIAANGCSVSGSYKSTGWGLDVGAGYTWRAQNGLFVEPYAHLSYLTVGASDYVIDGAAAHNDRYNSFLGELGLRMGSDFRLGTSAVRPYLQLSALNEFSDGNTVSLAGASTNASIDGAAWRTGAGVQVDFTKMVSGYAGLSYTKGDHYEAPVQGFVGLNVQW